MNVKLSEMLAYSDIVYGGIFKKWWLAVGSEQFFKYAKEHGIEYIDLSKEQERS